MGDMQVFLSTPKEQYSIFGGRHHIDFFDYG